MLAAAQLATRRLNFVGKTEVDGTGAVNYPAGTSPGDLLVLFAIANGTISTPSGWTLTANYAWTGSMLGLNSYVFTKICAADTSVTPATATQGGCILLVYRGGSGVPSVGAVGGWTQSADAATTLVNTAITPQDAISLVLGWCCDRTVVLPTNPGGAWVSRSNFLMTNFGNDVSEKAFGSTSSTGTATWTQSPTNSFPAAGLLLEIKP